MNSSSKMMFAVAVVALFAVAAIGVGYAYTAQTSNSDNNITNTFMTLSQDTMTGEIDDNAIAWNSVQTAGLTDMKITMAYYMDSGIDSTGKKVAVNTTLVSGKNLIKVGELTVNADSSANDVTGYTFAITEDATQKLVRQSAENGWNLSTGATTGAKVTFSYYVSIKATQATTIDSATNTEPGTTEFAKELNSSTGATFTLAQASAAVDSTITVSLYVEQVVSTNAVSVKAALANQAPESLSPVNGFQLDFTAEITVPTN